MFEETTKGLQRVRARAILGPLFSFHFMRRRALAMLNRHFDKGELTLRYRMKDNTLFLDPADDVIAARVLLRGDWQRRDLLRVIALLKKHVPDSAERKFIDVGANIGTETIYAMLSGHFSGAVSIEPEPHNFCLLAENIAANALGARAHAVNCAAGAKAGKAFLARSESNKGGHALTADVSGADRIPVDVRSVDAILADLGIDPSEVGLVWIDVNGTEEDVLSGLTSVLRHKVPVVLEHLPTFITADQARSIHRLLAAHYRHYCRVDDVDREPADVVRMDPLKDTGDFLFF
jgi:FkbM family methyltransferase